MLTQVPDVDRMDGRVRKYSLLTAYLVLLAPTTVQARRSFHNDLKELNRQAGLAGTSVAACIV